MQGVLWGFGSWYKRTPLQYSCEELHAEQGHEDRIRTVDLYWSDAKQRRNRDDDSQLSSDWKDRTSIDDGEYCRKRHRESKLAPLPDPKAYQA